MICRCVKRKKYIRLLLNRHKSSLSNWAEIPKRHNSLTFDRFRLNLNDFISDDAVDFFSEMVIGIILFLFQSTPDAARTPTPTIAVVAISNNQKCVEGLTWPPTAATPVPSHSSSQTWRLLLMYNSSPGAIKTWPPLECCVLAPSSSVSQTWSPIAATQASSLSGGGVLSGGLRE